MTKAVSESISTSLLILILASSSSRSLLNSCLSSCICMSFPVPVGVDGGGAGGFHQVPSLSDHSLIRVCHFLVFIVLCLVIILICFEPDAYSVAVFYIV